MAIVIESGNRGTATEKTSDQTLSFSPIANFTAGNYALLAVVIDNTGTAEGVTNDISVTDTKGNSYFKLREQTEANTAALTGVTCALFLACVSNGLLTTDTINIALAANATAKGAGLAELSVAAGKILVLSVDGEDGSNAAATTSYSVALSGLTNVAGLYIGISSCEDELDSACTLDAAYAEIGFGSIGSGVAGGNATNVRARVGTLANTSTGNTFDNTGLTSGEKATILVRLQEDDLDLRRQTTKTALQAPWANQNARRVRREPYSRLRPEEEAPLLLARPILVVSNPALFVQFPQTHSRLEPPVVVDTVSAFIAEPLRIIFRTAVAPRPIHIKSFLRPPQVVEPAPPPVIPFEENLAPVIYGYGAM